MLRAVRRGFMRGMRMHDDGWAELVNDEEHGGCPFSQTGVTSGVDTAVSWTIQRLNLHSKMVIMSISQRTLGLVRDRTRHSERSACLMRQRKPAHPPAICHPHEPIPASASRRLRLECSHRTFPRAYPHVTDKSRACVNVAHFSTTVRILIFCAVRRAFPSSKPARQASSIAYPII